MGRQGGSRVASWGHQGGVKVARTELEALKLRVASGDRGASGWRQGGIRVACGWRRVFNV